MVQQVRELARLVRSGGVLAVTMWGRDLFAPLYTPFLESVRRLRPGLGEYRPWDRVTMPEALSALMRDAGIDDFDVEFETGHEPLARSGDWCTIILGTGVRWFVDQVPRGTRDHFIWTTSNAPARSRPSKPT